MLLYTYTCKYIYLSDIPAELQLSELNLDDIDAKVEEQIVQEELDKEQEAIASSENLPPVRMPFPELRYLNVAFNRVWLTVPTQLFDVIVAFENTFGVWQLEISWNDSFY